MAWVMFSWCHARNNDWMANTVEDRETLSTFVVPAYVTIISHYRCAGFVVLSSQPVTGIFYTLLHKQDVMVRFKHILVAVATVEDASKTCTALRPYLETADRVTAVHVIEKGGGAPDKAPLEKRREDGHEILSSVSSALNSTVEVETEIVYGTDVVDTIFEAAVDADAEAVAFQARGGSRITRLLSGDTTSKLVTDPAVPVISLPKQSE